MELIELFENYADWLIEVWDFLENGEYSCVLDRRKGTSKRLLTQDVVI